MLITLQKNYDTSKKNEYKELLKWLNKLTKKEQAQAFLKIKNQIEEAFSINEVDLKLYKLCSSTRTTNVISFNMQYIRYTEQELENREYTFLNGTFYILPQSDKSEDTLYVLMDKLVYESMRHDFDKEPCKSLRSVICKFMPNSKNYSVSTFQNKLLKRESDTKTYYSECLSEDSDSEEEKSYLNTSKKIRAAKTQEAKTYCNAAQSNRFFGAFKKQSSVVDTTIRERPTIKRSVDFNRRQAKSDLDAINEQLKGGESINDEFLASLSTQFMVAQYRGIHYVTSRWDAVARRQHRALDEVDKPQYSSAVFKSTSVDGYHDMLNKTQNDPDINEKLVKEAEMIEGCLLKMQQGAPCSFGGYAYENPFFLLQKQYSENYDGFPNWLNEELKKKNSVYNEFLQTSERPLFSTSDVPNHALKYAFGVKLYEGHKDERLRPRWRANLRAERPYSGKVYLSLHPLTDYEQHKPSHLTSLFKQGQVNLGNVIVAERETSFLGYMPAERVAYHFKAKYPSFHGAYKTIFHHKYGIDANMYVVLQKAFKDFAPHSTERKNVTKALGDYLSAFNEVRLVAKAELLARKKNTVLIYRDEDGYFNLNLPDTPTTANKRLKLIINAKRDIYKVIAQGKSKHLQVINYELFDKEKQTLLYIQNHFKILLDNSYSLSNFKSIPLEKLELINNEDLLELIANGDITLEDLTNFDEEQLPLICQDAVICTIVEDVDNFAKICTFSANKFRLLADETLLELLEDNHVSIAEISLSKTRDLARLLTFNNLQKPLNDGYSLAQLLESLNEDEDHIRCLTADSFEEFLIDEAPNVSDTILEYAKDIGIDFKDILRALCSSERILFNRCLAEYFDEPEDESYSM